MPTIGQLPSLSAVDAADEIPLSHGGATQSVSVGTLLSGLQPAILAPTGTLLGRESLGLGGPEPISIGVGLGLQSSVLAATGADHATFPIQTVLEPSDQAVLSSGGSPMLLELSLLRGLFSAGSNIAISSAGTISAAGSAISTGTTGVSYSIADLPVATVMSAGDLVGISQGGTGDSITYQNFLNGLTINEAQPAVAASNSDATWVAQGSDTMVCQTFSAIWAWIVSNQPSYKCPVVEITTNTILDETVHNGRILVCSQPITLTPVFANMGSGFSCSVINLSAANVTFGAGIMSSSGVSVLPSGLACMMLGVAYSGGSVVYASISGGVTQSTQTIPAAVTGVVITGASSNGVSLAWVAPASGGSVTSYSVQYQTSGATTWTAASSAVIGTSYNISTLQPSTIYNFVVIAANSAGPGPSSSIVMGATIAAAGILPGEITGLTVNAPTSTTLSLAWSAPSVGTAPIIYTVSYRLTGSTAWMTNTSGLSDTATIVTDLSSNTSYDFEVFASNSAGSGPSSGVATEATAAVVGVVPGQVTGLTVSAPTSTTLSLTWSGPSIGTTPISFTVNYRPTGATAWTTYVVGLSSAATGVTGLSASTSYDFEVFATNALGNGPPSSVVSQNTVATNISVTAATWNVPPSGSYTHGSGSIGVNAQITPSNAPVQFGCSTSPTSPPANWTQASYVNTNLWGAYINVPATPGTWYAWVEGTNGSLPTVCSTPFTVT
jgi:hypothetical protein